MSARRGVCNVTAMRMTTGTTVAAALAALVTSTLPTLLPGGARSGRALAAAAVAEPAAARRDEAKAAFGRGNAAYNLGKYADAIAEFERAYALSRLPEILFNLGQCYRKQWEAEQRSELGRRALHYYEARRPRGAVFEGPTRRRSVHHRAGPGRRCRGGARAAGKIAAAKGADALQLAQTMFTGGQLNDAAGVLDRLLREPGNGRELLAEGYLLRGRVAAGTGNPLAAEGQFRRALELRPSSEIAEPKGPGEPPRWRRRARRTAAGGLRLVQSPPGEATANQPARIDVKVEGDSEKMVATLELGYRAAEHRRVHDRAGDAARDAVRAGADAGARARASTTTCARWTSTAVWWPRAARPPCPSGCRWRCRSRRAAEPPRWYQKWWFWTLVGAAAVGAGAITYAETRPPNELVIPGPTAR